MTIVTNLAIAGHQGAAVPNQFLRQDGEADHLAIFLLGFGYTCEMPLFFYAQNLLEERGADILRVEYAYWNQSEFKNASDDAQRQWLLDDATAAFRAGIAQRDYRTVTLIGKSFGTLAMGHLLTMSERTTAVMQAVWLTPLLKDEILRRQMTSCRTRSLIVIGSADPHDAAELLGELPSVETIVIENADHGLDIPGDVLGSIDAIHQAIAALDRWVRHKPARTDSIEGPSPSSVQRPS